MRDNILPFKPIEKTIKIKQPVSKSSFDRFDWITEEDWKEINEVDQRGRYSHSTDDDQEV
ncbi:hypothetical protein [Paenibacillus sp. WLX2291]|uniref:hypothetical protein n=1 Tax=Paenibacillus sp. WLX2291 TaxID=3296934 RepID=UPI0039843544